MQNWQDKLVLQLYVREAGTKEMEKRKQEKVQVCHIKAEEFWM